MSLGLKKLLSGLGAPYPEVPYGVRPAEVVAPST
jgi:hypothetical protein